MKRGRPVFEISLALVLLLIAFTAVRWLAVRVFGHVEFHFDPRRVAGAVAVQTMLVGVAAWLLLRRVELLRGRVASVLAAGALLLLPVLVYSLRYESAAVESARRHRSWRVGSIAMPLDPAASGWFRDFTWELSEGDDPELAVEMHIIYGDLLMRLGDGEGARTHLKEARRICEESGLAAPVTLLALRKLAIAYVRQSETLNCIALHGPDSCIYPLHGDGLWEDKSAAVFALEALEACLDVAPGDVAVEWVQNLVLMANGEPEAGFDQVELTALGRGEDGVPHFTNIAPTLGVGANTLAGGAIADDFDGDGFLDLVGSTSRHDDHVRYLHNDGQGGFEDWTERAGLTGFQGVLNMSHADFDGDGRLDLLLLRGAWTRRNGDQRNYLLRQNESGVFEDVTEQAGLAEVDWPCIASAWADYDCDGDLDVYIGNEFLEDGVAAPSQLFRNDGNGRFTDVAAEAGVINDRMVRGLCWGDFDDDGWPDLSVSNLLGPNRLYRNLGDGTFEDAAVELGVSSHGYDERTFATWFFDVNNDGALDLFCASYPLAANIAPAVVQRVGQEAIAETCKLFLNDGSGHFTDVTEAFGLDRTHLTMGANFGDVDNDGWLDIYIGTGSPSFEALVPNTLYRNRAGTGYVNATTATGLGHLQKGHGIAFGDLDNDGDQDVYAQLGGFYLDDGFQDGIFQNEGSPHHWVTLQLRSESANRFALGARVRLRVADDEGESREIHRVVGPGGSFGGNSLQLEVGLGNATRIEELEIRWPGQGETELYRDVPIDQRLTIVEGEGDWKLATSALE